VGGSIDLKLMHGIKMINNSMCSCMGGCMHASIHVCVEPKCRVCRGGCACLSKKSECKKIQNLHISDVIYF
jgi:hypothetical protein